MFYAVNNTRLNVLEAGSGQPALVLLHYFGGSAKEWKPVVDRLSDAHHCVAIDMRGHGDSDAPPTGYSVASMADDVLGVIETLNLTDFGLVGHSMSGKVALSLASRQPVGLRALVLVSPSPPLPEPIPDADRQDMLDTHGQRAAAEKTFDTITAKPLPEGTKEQIIADNLRTAEVAWRAWLIEGSREDSSAQMANIDVPVSIISGMDDKAIAPDVQPNMTLPYVPNATFDTVAGAGHLLPYEVPDELTNFIRERVGK